MEILAIIPARGGSKGLPGKNIRLLSGHPLIAYSICAAKQSRNITRITVNTDNTDIAETAARYGAEIFIRPSELGLDHIKDIEVFAQQLTRMREEENYSPDLVVQLRPTSPLRNPGLVDACIEKLLHSDADSLRVVMRTPLTPYKMWVIENPEKPMRPLLEIHGVEEAYNAPRQELPEIYWQTGAVDVIRRSVITENKSMSGKRILPFILESNLTVDIDTMEDFMKAEAILPQGDFIRCDG